MDMSREELAQRFSTAAQRRLELRNFTIELSKLGDFIMRQRAMSRIESKLESKDDRPAGS